MKRSPLKRKTPMKRGASAMKRTRIAPVSKKRQKEGSEYSRLRKEFLLAHPRCMCEGRIPGCTALSTEVHHAAKRGVNYLRVDTWRALSSHCHAWCEQHRKQAEAMGLTLTIEQIRKLNENES